MEANSAAIWSQDSTLKLSISLLPHWLYMPSLWPVLLLTG